MLLCFKWAEGISFFLLFKLNLRSMTILLALYFSNPNDNEHSSDHHL